MVDYAPHPSIPGLDDVPNVANIARPKLLKLYSTMLRIRRMEQALMEEYHPADEMRCPVHFCLGQESPPAGACLALEEDDTIFTYHRSHGYFLAKGAPMRGIFAELYGKATGSNGGKAGHQELSDEGANFFSGTILVGTLPIGAGAALSYQARGQDRVAMVVLGDGGADEGLAYETLNFAALWQLPMVFVCENNSYSTYSRQSSRQPLLNLAERARAFGVPSRRLYGNDAASVYRAVRRAVGRARSGRGPSFVELVTYRWCGHVGPEVDDHLKYRSMEELDAWKERDPIKALGSVMMEKNLLSTAEIEQMERDVAAEIQDAFDFAKASPFPDPAELLTDVFASDSASAESLKLGLPTERFDYSQTEAQLRPY